MMAARGKVGVDGWREERSGAGTRRRRGGRRGSVTAGALNLGSPKPRLDLVLNFVWSFHVQKLNSVPSNPSNPSIGYSPFTC